MIRIVRVLAAIPLALSVLAFQEEPSGADPVVEAVIKEGRANPLVMAHLDHLVNKIGPRLTSSDRLTKAQEWAKEQFESWGLKARLEEWGSFPVGFNRGPWSGKMTEPEELDLTFITRSWSPGTKGPQAGPALLAPGSEEEFERLKPKMKGAWILTSGVSTPRAVNDRFLAACDEMGALGLIRSGKGPLIITDGNHNISFDRLPKRVNILMLQEHYDKIAAHLKAGTKVGLTFDIKNEFKKGPIPQYNVIAEIPGTEKPDELVIVGGHIDSWDGATGTTDNGTGTVTTMEAARLLAKAGAKPKRTIRFMLWGGEEQGLLGSRGYVAKHPEEMAKISAVLVHDGGTNYVSGIVATAAMAPIFEKVFAPVKDLNKDFKFVIDQQAGLPLGIGSDHDTYVQRGVPGFFWKQAGRANYTRTHHTQFDTFEAGIKEYEEHTSMVVAIGAWGIANLPALLPRDGLKAGGSPGGGRRLGINIDDDGHTITSIEEGYPAEKAGLKVGDTILSIGGKEVNSYESLRAAIQAASVKTKIRIRRLGKEFELPLVFEK